MANETDQEKNPKSGCTLVALFVMSFLYLGVFILTTVSSIRVFELPSIRVSVLIVLAASPGLYGLWLWWHWNGKSRKSTVTIAVTTLLLVLVSLMLPRQERDPSEPPTEAILALDEYIGTDYTISELRQSKAVMPSFAIGDSFDPEIGASHYRYLPEYCLRVDVDGSLRDFWIERVEKENQGSITILWYVTEGWDNASEYTWSSRSGCE